ncbi:hypothetical protein RDV89_09670 [Nocardioides zeae]|uniref:Secreted protein n=1 Tax=Nocardioides imazamoxiresistens TaxID=3231893 RepID=A0ABU3PVR2_9ACTN|nr:hypothetical protein [Nocardioides zeae]MDT9593335.1 hypothetical protein [Nocardioides zeae]
MSEDEPGPVPTMMKRRWWVTVTVALAGLVVLVWWLRQPDGEPPTDDPEPTESSEASGATGDALVLPETFEAGGATWTRDASEQAQNALEAALGDGFDGRTVAEDGSPAGAVYVVDGSTDPLIVSLEVGDELAASAPADTAYQVVTANLGQDVAVGEVDDAALACGFLPVVVGEGESQQAQQWVCAAARGDAVANLLWPLTVTTGDDAAALGSAFLDAATT